MKKTKVLCLLCALMLILVMVCLVACDTADTSKNHTENGDANNMQLCAHDWISATCTSPKTCKLCNTTEGTANEHTWLSATCTEPKTCQECDKTTGVALGHTAVIDAAVAPTCTVAGKTEGKHCSVCNEVLVAQDRIDKLSHTEVVDAAVAATCTMTGKTEGKHCSVCNQVLVAQNTVSTLSHNWQTATCTTPKTCTVCGTTSGSVNTKAHVGVGKCTLCQTVYLDSLANYVMMYGTQGATTTYSYATYDTYYYLESGSYKFSITYRFEQELFIISLRKNKSDAPFFTLNIQKDASGSYNYTYNDIYGPYYGYGNGVWDTIRGTIVAENFTSATSQLPYSSVECKDGKHSNAYISSVAATQMKLWLTCFDRFCNDKKLGISSANLGFPG